MPKIELEKGRDGLAVVDDSVGFAVADESADVIGSCCTIVESGTLVFLKILSWIVVFTFSSIQGGTLSEMAALW